MKKLLLRIVICMMLILGLAGKNSGQIILPEIIINRPAGLTKVLVVFERMYKEAREPHWYVRGGNYIVTFLMNDLKYNVVFMKSGELIYQISYGNERNIPEQFKSLIRRKFQNYAIISAINYRQDSRNMWLFTGESEKDFLNLKIDKGIIVEEKRTLKHSKR